MENLRVEQQIRLALANDPYTDPIYQHEGPEVIRWITGGTIPSIYATFQKEGSITVLYCPQCGERLGQFDENNTGRAASEIAKIRETGSKHQRQHLSRNSADFASIRDE